MGVPWTEVATNMDTCEGDPYWLMEPVARLTFFAEGIAQGDMTDEELDTEEWKESLRRDIATAAMMVRKNKETGKKQET